MTARLYIVTGISGSGKTTVARHLLQHGEVAFDSKINPGLYHFVDSEGNVARTIQLDNDEWKRRYKWSLNEPMLTKLLQEHSDARRVFLCGRANIYQYWHKADKVFLLRVSAPTLLRRLNNESRDNLFAKDAVTQEQLLASLDVVQNKISQKGAVTIDAEVPIEYVVDQIFERAT